MTEPDPAVERFREDPLADHLAMSLAEVRDGFARTEMEAAEELCSFQGYVQSGALVALADYALSAAANAGGASAIPLSLSFTFVARVRPGGRLTAVAEAEKVGRRTGLYRLEVRTMSGDLVASGQGVVYRQEPASL